LRDLIGLTGIKFGCGIGQCGAFTLHLNGEAVRSCQIPVNVIQKMKITTIKGLSKENDHLVQQAWKELDVPQCGYCQSGQIMAAASLINKNVNPTNELINEYMNNICRCGTYARIHKGIHYAAKIALKESP
jgi:isoquinoline 1-oxidoreductase alpha subunit